MIYKSTLKKRPSSSSESGHEGAPIRISRPQFLYQNGQPVSAVVPIGDWERITDALDDLDEIFLLEEEKGDSSEKFLPAEIFYALLDGENPIRVWHEHRGLSRQQLAEAAGVSEPYLSQLEAGKREASQRLVRQLAKALRVDIDDLTRPEPEDDMAEPSSATDAGRRR